MPDIPVKIKSFSKGINQSVDKSILGVEYASKAENVSIDDGNLNLAGGTTLYQGNVLPSPIKTLMKFFRGTVGTVLAASGGKVYKINASGQWEEIASGFTSDFFDYVNYQVDETEIIIFTNGKENIKVWDGTTLSDLKHDGKGSPLGSSNKAPKGEFIELHKERIWVAPKDSNKIYFATAYDPHDFTAPVDEVEANQHGGEVLVPTWDGGVVLAIKNLFDNIMIFKTHTIFRVFGTYPAQYEMVEVFHTTNGEIIQNSIASMENMAYWLSTEGIHVFNGTNADTLTAAVKEYWKEVNRSYLKNAVGIVYKNKYIAAVPSGTSQVNDLVFEYDIKNQTFMVRRGMAINSFLEFGNKLLFTGEDGKIYEYNSGDDYSGQPINAHWTTGTITTPSLKDKKYASKIHFIGSGDGDVKISCITDFGTTSVTIPLTEVEKTKHYKLKNKGYWMQWRFENVNGSKFCIKSPEIEIYVQD